MTTPIVQGLEGKDRTKTLLRNVGFGYLGGMNMRFEVRQNVKSYTDKSFMKGIVGGREALWMKNHALVDAERASFERSVL